MLPKFCRFCNEQLIIGENWTEGQMRNSFYNCRSCTYKNNKKYYTKEKGLEVQKRYYKNNTERVRARMQKFWDSKKDGNQHVYIIDNYAGYTNCPHRRREEHRYFGKDDSTFRVIYSTPDIEEAKELEALLHDLGYEGKHTKSKK